MQQWEYMRLPATDFARGHVVGNKRMEPKFKSEGEAGWEMFAVTEFHCYFKRPVRQQTEVQRKISEEQKKQEETLRRIKLLEEQDDGLSQMRRRLGF